MSSLKPKCHTTTSLGSYYLLNTGHHLHHPCHPHHYLYLLVNLPVKVRVYETNFLCPVSVQTQGHPAIMILVQNLHCRLVPVRPYSVIHQLLLNTLAHRVLLPLARQFHHPLMMRTLSTPMQTLILCYLMSRIHRLFLRIADNSATYLAATRYRQLQMYNPQAPIRP